MNTQKSACGTPFDEEINMNLEKETIVRRIRNMGRAKRGRQPELLGLSDDALYEVYQLLNSHASARSVARHLRTRYGIGGSENSLRQSITRFKSRISSMLHGPLSVSNFGVSSNPWMRPADERLRSLRHIEQRYRMLINQQLGSSADQGKPLTPEMAKHIKVLTDLTRTVEKIEGEMKGSLDDAHSEGPVIPDEVFHRELDRRTNRLIRDSVGEEKNKMLLATMRMIQLAEECAIPMRRDPETGNFKPVENRTTRPETSAKSDTDDGEP
jgi:hypothetical protein